MFIKVYLTTNDVHMLLQESSDTTLFRLRNRELADTVEVATFNKE